MPDSCSCTVDAFAYKYASMMLIRIRSCIRSIYERAITYCGTDYLAHALWDKVIHHEEEQGVANAVAKAYCRVLGYPLRELPRYLQR